MTNLQTGFVGVLAVLLIAAIPGLYVQSEQPAQGEDDSSQSNQPSVIERVEPALKPGKIESVPKPDSSRIPETSFDLQKVGEGALSSQRGTDEWIRAMEVADNRLDLYGVEIDFCIEYRNTGSAGRFNMNNVTKAQLEKIDGVGPATAERILGHINSVSSVHSFYELIDISGFGSSMVETLVDQVHFDGRVPHRVEKENC